MVLINYIQDGAMKPCNPSKVMCVQCHLGGTIYHIGELPAAGDSHAEPTLPLP